VVVAATVVDVLLTHVGIALDHFPLRRHRSIGAPRSSKPSSHVNVMVSPIL
jgi:hypothetical protein